jgi:hypothetical protein
VVFPTPACLYCRRMCHLRHPKETNIHHQFSRINQSILYLAAPEAAWTISRAGESMTHFPTALCIRRRRCKRSHASNQR